MKRLFKRTFLCMTFALVLLAGCFTAFSFSKITANAAVDYPEHEAIEVFSLAATGSGRSKVFIMTVTDLEFLATNAPRYSVSIDVTDLETKVCTTYESERAIRIPKGSYEVTFFNEDKLPNLSITSYRNKQHGGEESVSLNESNNYQAVFSIYTYGQSRALKVLSDSVKVEIIGAYSQATTGTLVFPYSLPKVGGDYYFIDGANILLYDFVYIKYSPIEPETSVNFNAEKLDAHDHEEQTVMFGPNVTRTSYIALIENISKLKWATPVTPLSPSKATVELTKNGVTTAYSTLPITNIAPGLYLITYVRKTPGTSTVLCAANLWDADRMY